MAANLPLDLDARDLAQVLSILREQLPEYEIWAFGSRVAGRAKPYSDLDLAVLTDLPFSLERMATINDAFDQSDLTIRVDVVDWAATSEAFRGIIERDKVILQSGAK